MSTTNIYEDILGNIDADKKAWCQSAWEIHEDGTLDSEGSGKVISRCLVSHIDLALGTSYVKPNGKRFISKDVRKWRRRERVLAHLFSLLPKKTRATFVSDRWDEELGTYVETLPEEKEITKSMMTVLNLPGSERLYTPLSSAMVEFNDSFASKSKVRNLLKRAAKQHPED